MVEILASLIPNISSSTFKGKVQHKNAFLRIDLPMLQNHVIYYFGVQLIIMLNYHKMRVGYEGEQTV